jgi:ferredoxin
VADRLIDERGGIASLRPALDEVCAALPGELDLSPDGVEALREELEHLEARLPTAGTLVGPGARTLPVLYAAALQRRRRGMLEAFRDEAERLATRLAELLRVDAEHGSRSAAPGVLSAGLGPAATDFVDPQLLSRNLPEQRGPKRLDADRRARIADALRDLRRYVDEGPESDDLVIVHSGLLSESHLPEGTTSLLAEEPIAEAVGRFDIIAERMTATVRACRVARLELEGVYDPALHDPVLTSLHWQDFDDDELMALPVIAVMEEAERLRTRWLGAFSELMRSGRPLHVLGLDDYPRCERERPTGYHSTLGYVAVAHREVFVVQSTLARPEHLFSGLERMAIGSGPAAAIVTVPAAEADVDPFPLLTAALYGRTRPCYRYDAAAGTTWAERFDLDGNPQPEDPWPTIALRYVDGNDTEQRHEVTFTFAHAAALDPACRDHFQLTPPEAWDEEQVEIDGYLELPDEEQARRLPFVWVLDEEGRLVRAVITRQLAFACRDHARAWRIYQELGGAGNEYARRSASQARRQALEEAEEERRKLEAAHAVEVEEVRARAADEAVERLVGLLMSAESPSTVLAAQPLPATGPVEHPAADEAAAPKAEEAVEVAEEAEEELTFDEPFIDSIMCTSCDDCTRINPRMFRYNENKQAFIADPEAGTFEELVRAAEKCPARCIHPGKPRAGDDTATDEMVARAAPFNR